MSNIDVTGIIETNPVQGQPTTASVRVNFAAIKTQLSTAKTELENLSGIADPVTARANLGLVIGTNVQAYDATLQSLSALGTAADKIPYTTAVDTWAETPLTSFARTLLDDATSNDVLTTLTATRSEAGAVAVPVLNKLREAVSVKDFGAVGDGVTVNNTAIAAAIAAHDHVDISDGHFIITQSIKLRPGVKITGDALIENTSTTGYESAIFALGNVGWQESALLTYYACSNPSAGDTVVTLTTAADAANFAEDDFVFVRGGTYYTISGVNFYDYGSINRVSAVNAVAGTVTLKYSIDEDVTGFSIGNVTQSGVTSPVTGDALFAVEDVTIDGLSAKTNGVGPLFREGGGVLNCALRFRDVEADSIIYNNAWAHNTVRIDSARFKRHLWELALNSHHNVADVGYAKMTTTSTVGKHPIRTSENGRYNILRCKYLDMNIYTISDVPIYIGEGAKNEIHIDHLLAENAPLRIATFSSQAFAPTAPRLHENRLRIRNGCAGAGDYYVMLADTATTSIGNELVDSRFYGTVSTGVAVQIDGARPLVHDVWCEDGVLYRDTGTSDERVHDNYFADGFSSATLASMRTSGVYHNNASASLISAIAKRKDVGHTTVSSTTPGEVFQTQTFAAGDLKTGDVLRYELCGEVSGTAGTKTLEGYIGATKVLDMPYAAGETGDFHISGDMTVTALTSLVSAFRTDSGAASAAKAQVAGVVVSDLSANTLTIEFRAWKGAAGDTFFIRYFRAWIERFGA